MIIIKFQAGLGNQMFQYAFYYAMKSYYPDCQVKMDLTEYRYAEKNREFQLTKLFGIKCDLADDQAIRRIADYIPPSLKNKFFSKKIYTFRRSLIKKKIALLGRKFTHLLQDDPTIFNQKIFELNTLYNYYCDGYWLNSGYFKLEHDDTANILRDIFNFRSFTLDAANQATLEQIKNTVSVAIHVRRGDYQGSRYDIVDISYYKKAIAFIQSRVLHPTYYVFSDSPEYCRESFHDVENKVIVGCNTENNQYMDMYLMSQCQHNIIANSSFSFWGAYLNGFVDKIVVAPDRYLQEFRNSLALDDWICLPNS